MHPVPTRCNIISSSATEKRDRILGPSGRSPGWWIIGYMKMLGETPYGQWIFYGTEGSHCATAFRADHNVDFEDAS